MLETLSQLVRKPSKISNGDFNTSKWQDARSKVLQHMEDDDKLQELLQHFKVANDNLKMIRSVRDIKIYYLDAEKGGESYKYARCMFNINGKPKEFRKYLGRTDDIQEVNESELKKIFLNMLKNFLG